MAALKLKDLNPGDVLKCVHGFTREKDEMCISHGEIRTVEMAEQGLCVKCDEGNHYLVEDDNGEVYDFELVSKAENHT